MSRVLRRHAFEGQRVRLKDIPTVTGKVRFVYVANPEISPELNYNRKAVMAWDEPIDPGLTMPQEVYVGDLELVEKPNDVHKA